ncbi:MAG: hypothetical protein AAF243_02800 [Cyanobacteria bacterium P01_A01_bin.137]
MATAVSIAAGRLYQTILHLYPSLTKIFQTFKQGESALWLLIQGIR